MAPIVEIQGLRKKFGSAPALDGLDLSLEHGQVLGFLGPNGAGKSTTIRILLGLLRADSGVVRLFGADPWASAVVLHRRLAYVPGDVSLWPNLTGGQAIDLLLHFHGTGNPRLRDQLVERFELDPGKKARAYSKGNRQKVALIAALASEAPLLIFDEPTSGLDPLMEQVFQECVGEAKARGTSVLLSSHILAEVEKLADAITIIRAGKAVVSGTLGELRNLTSTVVTATTRRPATELAGLPGLRDLEQDGLSVRFRVDSGKVNEALSALASANVVQIACAPPSLEELFLDQYRTGRRSAAEPASPVRA
ncbi:ABC transporter ATP-binding protein [Segniliparus rugosus]|uniref:ABC transporter domain-containing protein n=1 Tax=Segniliparus rugosus (strain ATCC BAA-974 / DSM 45345 / CCUG 50838 / CIP 108380 / JCM 13579 / CDC 945) TaxID=679197 RepID=E5XUD0_SEGRC|nr:ABC transporter ATP-binding protein [Segniliparus rugosus]EFV12071.1 hypothetical protein HMPREF9336_03102 [Segniliparus rugosus ATCC BAA-974]